MSSEVVAAFIGAVATLLVGGPFAFWLNRKLERYKTDLHQEIATSNRLFEARFAAYPTLLGLISKVIRGCRDTEKDADPVGIRSLASNVKQLEGSLDSAQIAAQRDQIHADIHNYKNDATTFVQLLRDREVYKEKGDVENVDQIGRELTLLLARLESSYPSIRSKMVPLLFPWGDLADESRAKSHQARWAPS